MAKGVWPQDIQEADISTICTSLAEFKIMIIQLLLSDVKEPLELYAYVPVLSWPGP